VEDGDGSKIKVMSEPWLGGENLWIQSPQIQSMYDLHVNNLILQDVKGWDNHKIHSLFHETVAATILRTPLFEVVEEDKLVWIHENHGEYKHREVRI
jgi:hypothetical protein